LLALCIQIHILNDILLLDDLLCETFSVYGHKIFVFLVRNFRCGPRTLLIMRFKHPKATNIQRCIFTFN